jgi:hypothetical protein
MGIIHTYTATDTSIHNSVIERKIKSLVGMACCMLIHSGILKKF